VRPEDLTRLETAVREANPVPHPHALVDSHDAAAAPIRQRIRTTTTPPRPTTRVQQTRKLWWSRPAVVFAVWFLLVLSVVGIAVLLSNSQPRFVDKPAPTTTAPVTPIPGASAGASDRVNRVRGLAVSTDGSLWAATGDGVVRWDLATQTPTVYTADQGLPAGAVNYVEAGSDGTVWVGGWADESGWLARFDGTLTTFSVPSLEPVAPIAIGPDGSAWIAMPLRELGRFDGSEWQVFEAPFGRVGELWSWASSLAFGPDGTLWALIGTGEVGTGGVASFDGSTWTRYTDPNGSLQEGGSIKVAPDGTVWVGTTGAVARFDGNTWTRFTTADGLPSSEYLAVSIGTDGSVWAVDVSGGAVARFDGASWTLFADMGGIGGAVHAKGTLWRPAIGTDGGIVGFDGVETIHLVVPFDESTTEVPVTAILPAAGEWNPILAETLAKPAPPAASCPPGTDPNAPGPVDQERPKEGWTSLLGAAFDQHTGRIVYVDTLGETWTFDVCTNTWHRMNPTGVMIGDLSAGMVYDVDSDLTVALGWEHISVYDANTNTWTQPSNDTVGTGDGLIVPMGAVYDPISGLIITTDLTDLDTWAYDVDTNTWTRIGRLWEQQGQDYTWFELLGYSQESDRLIFTSVDDITALVDPRTGDKTLITTATPGISFGWPKAQYGPAADTVYVAEGVWTYGGVFDTRFPGQICGFDPGTFAWTSCFAIPNGPRYASFAAMVGDPINNRLVLINGVYGNFWVNADGNVWAIDLDTGELTRLLAPYGQ